MDTIQTMWFCLVFCFAAYLPATVLHDSLRPKFRYTVVTSETAPKILAHVLVNIQFISWAKLELSRLDWQLAQHVDEHLQLASCCIVGTIQLTSQKKATHKTIASCKWTFTSEGSQGEAFLFLCTLSPGTL